MNKFWKWIEDKGYVVKDEEYYVSPECKLGCITILTKQMLIGYMIEYLQEKKIPFDLDWNDIPVEYLPDILMKYIKGEIKLISC